jgi:hypothetical protein
MAVLTGSSGELRFNGVRIGKCREYTLNIARDSLETTTLGSYDRTYVPGIRGTSGSATILYDKDDFGTVAILNSVFTNSTDIGQVKFVFDTAENTEIEVDAFITQVSTPVSVGAVTACSINFQASGSLSGTF